MNVKVICLGICLYLLFGINSFAGQQDYQHCDRYYNVSGFLVSAICYYKKGSLVKFKELKKTPIKKWPGLYDLRIEKRWNSATGKLYSEVQHTPKRLFTRETTITRIYDESGNIITAEPVIDSVSRESKKEWSDYLVFIPDNRTLFRIAVVILVLIAAIIIYRHSKSWQKERKVFSRLILSASIFLTGTYLTYVAAFITAFADYSSGAVLYLVNAVCAVITAFVAYIFWRNTYSKEAQRKDAPGYWRFLLVSISLVGVLYAAMAMHGENKRLQAEKFYYESFVRNNVVKMEKHKDRNIFAIDRFRKFRIDKNDQNHLGISFDVALNWPVSRPLTDEQLRINYFEKKFAKSDVIQSGLATEKDMAFSIDCPDSLFWALGVSEHRNWKCHNFVREPHLGGNRITTSVTFYFTPDIIELRDMSERRRRVHEIYGLPKKICLPGNRPVSVDSSGSCGKIELPRGSSDICSHFDEQDLEVFSRVDIDKAFSPGYEDILEQLSTATRPGYVPCGTSPDCYCRK